jgi:hypothetical protein
MWDIFRIIKGKKTKLVLYTYDSFLFDLDINEKNIADELINLFKTNNLPTKIKNGYNYNF